MHHFQERPGSGKVLVLKAGEQWSSPGEKSTTMLFFLNAGSIKTGKLESQPGDSGIFGWISVRHSWQAIYPSVSEEAKRTACILHFDGHALYII